MDKTIHMPADLLANWLAALRSGKYEQGYGLLMDGEGRFCCLGVLQDVVDCVESYGSGKSYCLPSMDWLRAHNIEFSGDDFLPNRSPLLPKFGREAHQVNDDGESFAEIADAIEACAEVTPAALPRTD